MEEIRKKKKKKKKKTFWDQVIDKFAKKICKWSNLTLSKGGRLTLAQLVLCLPLYYFSDLKAPVGVTQEMDRLVRNFFWDRRMYKQCSHLVNWEKLLPHYFMVVSALEPSSKETMQYY